MLIYECSVYVQQALRYSGFSARVASAAATLSNTRACRLLDDPTMIAAVRTSVNGPRTANTSTAAALLLLLLIWASKRRRGAAVR